MDDGDECFDLDDLEYASDFRATQGGYPGRRKRTSGWPEAEPSGAAHPNFQNPLGKTKSPQATAPQ